MSTINKAGELVQHIHAAATEHGLSPLSDVFVRDGPEWVLRRIQHVKGFRDQRGFALILELHPTKHVLPG